MATTRRHLRFWAAAWLVFQAASLTALVPRQCCTAHPMTAATTEAECHEEAPTPAEPDCQMAGGTPCPMHHGGHSETSEGTADCSIRGMCDGPAATFLGSLANHGVLTDPFTITPDLHPKFDPPVNRESLIGRQPGPDSPPPRA
jgi:hypothetical protein